MEKARIELAKVANTIISSVYRVLKDYAAGREIIVFDRETIEDTDDLYKKTKAWAYFVDKHGGHIEGAVERLEGNNAILFLTGENDFGEEHKMPLDEIPVEAAVWLLEHLK